MIATDKYQNVLNIASKILQGKESRRCLSKEDINDVVDIAEQLYEEVEKRDNIELEKNQ